MVVTIVHDLLVYIPSLHYACCLRAIYYSGLLLYIHCSHQEALAIRVHLVHLGHLVHPFLLHQ